MKLFGTLCEMVLKIKTRSSGNQTNWFKKNTPISWNRWTLGLKCLAPHVNWISKRYQVHLEPNKLSPNTKHETLKENSNNSTQTPHGYFETEKGWDVWIVWHLMWTGSYSKYQVHLEPHKLIPSNTNHQHLGAENNENVWSLLWAKFSENTSSTMNQTILIYRKYTSYQVRYKEDVYALIWQR